MHWPFRFFVSSYLNVQFGQSNLQHWPFFTLFLLGRKVSNDCCKFTTCTRHWFLVYSKNFCYCLFSNSITFLWSHKETPFHHQALATHSVPSLWKLTYLLTLWISLVWTFQESVSYNTWPFISGFFHML